MAVRDVREELRCSICLELYSEPVTLACGHSFCRQCMERFLAEQAGGPQCPECRAPLLQWPLLQRSIALCNVVQHFRSLRRPEGVGIFCSYCLRAAVPAVRSCLHCEASLCDDHLIAHSKSPQHVLSDPGGAVSLEKRKCLAHMEVFRYYCIAEAVCICATCQQDGEHRGHPIESLDEAANRKKSTLRGDLLTLTAERKRTEHQLQRLRAYSKVAGDQPGPVSDLIKLLGIKQDKLSGKIRHIGEMSDTTDPLTVLCDQELASWDLAEEEEGAIEALYQGLISEHSHNTDLRLDLETAANNVCLSPDLKTLTWSLAYQGRPETPSRFQYNQVLSMQIFAFGSHSWEVEASESGDWRLGVVCHSAARKGDQSYLGDSDKSWCLRKLYSNQYSVMHDGRVVTTSHQFSCNRFRVCLDCEAGQLSFYEMSDPIRLLHTFTATFPEPLRAAFGTGYWLASENCWIRVGHQET